MSLSTPASSQRPSRPASRWPRLWGPSLALLLAFLAALFLYRVWVVQSSGISLFFDEAQYWDWAQDLSWGYYSKPPMIAGLIWLSTQLFGDGVLGVKLLVMLLYPLAALAMVGFARALWPTSSGVRTGVVAAALFATIPSVGLLGLVASTDAPLILCWTLAGWMLWRAQVTDRLGYWVALGVFCGLGLMSKYTMAAFAATAVWALWGIHGPRRGLFRLGPWVTVLVALALLSPNLWWNAHNGFPTLQHTAEITTQSSRQGGFKPALVFALGQILMLGPIAVLAGWWLRRRRGEPQARESQMVSVPASQWAPTSIMDPTRPAVMPDEVATPRKVAARNSPYYLASESSFRFLWALSVPLQLIAVVQAFHADAHINWAAPSMVGFCLLIAARLSPPLARLADPRPKGWLVAVLLSNIVLTSVVLHLRDIVGPTLPSKLDVLVRMRGWDQAFQQLTPAITDPTTTGLPVLTTQRLLITHTAYHWREHHVRTLYWNPQGTRNNHYEITHSLPDKVGADVLLVTSQREPTDITSRFATSRLMASTRVPVGPDRSVELHAFFLRGFLGYGPRPEGAQPAPRQDD
ncbi:MAG: glycosyltransferase family 39 protein [Aquabacterium sp.]|uniref:ArnT family glycosyltransferase n=1 Tax=Aquabacterium sp. TaxID=1872578 RepID=UPI002A36070A|nr:glycosyltransferase family 39 protein [Aquabacterium sp.]MDX9844916.1 glycosyltransferase family 39 protein [Aquabacterium sp.]